MAGSNAAEKNKPKSAVIVDISGEGGNSSKDSASGNRKKKKKGGSIKLFIFLILFFVALVCSAVVIYINDFFAVQTTIIEIAHSIDPEYRGITEKEAELNLRDEKQEALQAKLDAEEKRLATLEQELAKKEQDVAILERSKTPVYRPPINEDDVVYMQNIGKIYGAMEPANAAKAMAELRSVEDMAAIIYFMSQKNAAAVLELMDPKIAALITEQLLHD